MKNRQQRIWNQNLNGPNEESPRDKKKGILFTVIHGQVELLECWVPILFRISTKCGSMGTGFGAQTPTILVFEGYQSPPLALWAYVFRTLNTSLHSTGEMAITSIQQNYVKKRLLSGGRQLCTLKTFEGSEMVMV